MSATISDVRCRSKGRVFTLPYVNSNPFTAPDISNDPDLQSRGCFDLVTRTDAHDLDWKVGDSYGPISGPCGGGTGTGWPSAWTFRVTLTPVGDAGDCTWQYTIGITVALTGATATGVKYTLFGTDYHNGDTIYIPHNTDLLTWLEYGNGEFSFTYTCTTGPLVGSHTQTQTVSLGGDPFITGHGGNSWGYVRSSDDYLDAEKCLGPDARYYPSSDLLTTTYFRSFDCSNGHLDCQRAEWRATVNGATPYTPIIVYFHIESRPIGVGSWTETNQIALTVLPNGDGAFITPWVFLPFDQCLADYEFRLKAGNEVDFTDNMGGPPPPPGP